MTGGPGDGHDRAHRPRRTHARSFAGRPVAVLGLARSGIALARYLHDQGARVTVYDARPAAELAEAIGALGGRDVALRLGPDVDPAAVLDGQALVATSPSISSRYPDHRAAPARRARRRSRRPAACRS